MEEHYQTTSNTNTAGRTVSETGYSDADPSLYEVDRTMGDVESLTLLSDTICTDTDTEESEDTSASEPNE